MAIDHSAYESALFSHLRGLLVCEATEDEVTPLEIGCTSTGYTRNVGSWIDDGFVIGMETLAGGFASSANNAPKNVSGVSALFLTVKEGCTVEAAAAGRAVEVGLPSRVVVADKDFVPPTGHVYVTAEYIPGPSPRQITGGQGGELEVEPLYKPRFFVPSSKHAEALKAYRDATVTHFKPATSISVGNGDAIRVPPEAGPSPSQILNTTAGWATVAVSVPCRIRTPNN